MAEKDAIKEEFVIEHLNTDLVHANVLIKPVQGSQFERKQTSGPRHLELLLRKAYNNFLMRARDDLQPQEVQEFARDSTSCMYGKGYVVYSF